MASKISGLYYIHNTHNDKYYFGSSVNIKGRLSAHRGSLRRDVHENPRLQNDWNIYGEDSFVFCILYETPNVLPMEQYLLDVVFSEHQTEIYNIASNVYAGFLGKKHLRSTKEKISKAHVGKKLSEETKQKLSVVKKGKPGHKHTEEHKLKMSALQKGKPQLWARGRVKTIEHRIKIGNAHRGKKHSDAAKEKIGNANRGRRRTATYKANIAAKFAKEWPSIVDPVGKEYPPFLNLQQFCRDHSLNPGNMHQVFNGKYKQYKGWHLPSTTVGWPPIIDSDNKIHYPGTNLKQFCRENQLNYSSMKGLYNGKNKQIKGWKLLTSLENI